VPSPAYRTIIDAVEKYLRETQSLSRENSKSNKQIVNAIKEMIANGELTVDLSDGTMLAYISEAANNDDNSRIISGGPHAGYCMTSL
jgi:hypothetical protein